MKTLHKSITKTIVTTLTFALVAGTLAPAAASAGDEAPTGFFIGLDAGFGASSVGYEDGKKSITEEGVGGALGGLRLGYAFSPKLALSLEGHGFGRGDEDDGDEWTVGIAALAVTWRPWGSGFFVRAGAGIGDGEFRMVDSDQNIEVDERLAGLFAVGYDWRLGEHTALGLAATGFGLEAGGATGFDEDGLGAGGLVAQFTWNP